MGEVRGEGGGVKWYKYSSHIWNSHKIKIEINKISQTQRQRQNQKGWQDKGF